MSIARRNFLKTAARTTLSAGLALTSTHLIFGQQPGKRILGGTPSADFTTPLGAQEDPTFHFNLDTFKPYVGDIFQVPNSRGEMITLKLSRATEFRMPTTTIQKKAGRVPRGFSLSFTGDEQLPPFTSIHSMRHPALGSFDLFLTSTKTKNGSFVYEAVFNQID